MENFFHVEKSFQVEKLFQVENLLLGYVCVLACPKMSPVGVFHKAGVGYVVNDLFSQDGDSPDPFNKNFALRNLTDNKQ